MAPRTWPGNDLQTEAPTKLKDLCLSEIQEEEDLVEKRKSECGSEEEGKRRAGRDRREN